MHVSMYLHMYGHICVCEHTCTYVPCKEPKLTLDFFLSPPPFVLNRDSEVSPELTYHLT